MKKTLLICLVIVIALTMLGSGGWLMHKYLPVLLAEFRPSAEVNASQMRVEADAVLENAKDEYERWVAIAPAAMWRAVEGEDDAGAAKLASEALQLAAKYRDDWNYGNAIHKANSALGMIALRDGDRDKAIKHLLASAATKGSPQMNSFGPNMRFAKQMLDAQEAEAVLRYLELCRNFWELGQAEISAWESAIREGREPNFGANLLY
jgi:hypothetical protein